VTIDPANQPCGNDQAARQGNLATVLRGRGANTK
jgi:hypothetical protein